MLTGRNGPTSILPKSTTKESISNEPSHIKPFVLGCTCSAAASSRFTSAYQWTVGPYKGESRGERHLSSVRMVVSEGISTKPIEIRNVVVVGTGLMGTGVAQVALTAGYNVSLVGRVQEKCDASRAKILGGLIKIAKKKYANDDKAQNDYLDSNMGPNCDVFIEAIVENLKVKQKLFADIEGVISEDCIMVTNTSSFLLKDVSSKIQRKHNFAGLHFFNPVPAMKLVEVIDGEETSPAVFIALHNFCKTLLKTPVRCEDTPGFIVNHLLIPYLLEAMRMAERGDATRADIDTAMKLGASHPMGPFELSDYIGLDTMKFVIDGWHTRFPDDPRYVPSESLDLLVANGKFGRKTGEGFFKY
uniref:3-hydroxyacyl-CoA dehydrogenase n=1 Tax=Steinernema glaseri TaxID=37863 RepID=A0A1I7YFP1_9BILA